MAKSLVLVLRYCDDDLTNKEHYNNVLLKNEKNWINKYKDIMEKASVYQRNEK